MGGHTGDSAHGPGLASLPTSPQERDAQGGGQGPHVTVILVPTCSGGCWAGLGHPAHSHPMLCLSIRQTIQLILAWGPVQPWGVGGTPHLVSRCCSQLGRRGGSQNQAPTCQQACTPGVCRLPAEVGFVLRVRTRPAGLGLEAGRRGSSDPGPLGTKMRLYLRAGPPAPLEAAGTVGGVHSLGLKQWARLPEERRGPGPTPARHPRLPAHGLLPAALLQRPPCPVALLHPVVPHLHSASLVLSPLRTACSRLALRGSPWEEWKPGTPWPPPPMHPSRGAMHCALGWWALAQLPRESPDAGWKPTCHSWLGLSFFPLSQPLK